MRTKLALAGLVVMLVAAMASAQTPPRLVQFTGAVRPAEGPVQAGQVSVTFAIYADSEGSTPLWHETQAVRVDAEGRFAAMLGSTQPDGLPLDLFATGAARWLEISGDGLAAQARVMLVSVPYALKAADAETVGGRPLSAFLLAGEKTGVGADGLNYVNTKVLATGLSGGAPGGAGSANYIGVFTDTVNLGNSVIYQTPAGSIGVNTTAPLAGFHAVSGASPVAYYDVYSNALGSLPVVYRAARGTPSVPTAVQVNDILGGMAVRGYGATAWSSGRGQVMYKAAENWTDAAQGTYLQFTSTPTGSVAWAERMRITPNGFVGIGTATPTAMLHVAGDAVVDGNIAAKYQDVAEWVESGAPLEAGTVVVVDPAAANGVRMSARAYDVGVAGAVSAQPGVLLGERGDSKSLVAQSGRVRIKVDTKYGAIKAGDLLVTSPTAGYAMKSTPVKVHGVEMHRPGTILGKALESFAGGKGEILALITLQ
jgi:trimeric autotransporter adhesin